MSDSAGLHLSKEPGSWAPQVSDTEQPSKSGRNLNNPIFSEDRLSEIRLYAEKQPQPPHQASGFQR